MHPERINCGAVAHRAPNRSRFREMRATPDVSPSGWLEMREIREFGAAITNRSASTYPDVPKSTGHGAQFNRSPSILVERLAESYLNSRIEFRIVFRTSDVRWRYGCRIDVLSTDRF